MLLADDARCAAFHSFAHKRVPVRLCSMQSEKQRAFLHFARIASHLTDVNLRAFGWFIGFDSRQNRAQLYLSVCCAFRHCRRGAFPCSIRAALPRYFFLNLTHDPSSPNFASLAIFWKLFAPAQASPNYAAICSPVLRPEACRTARSPSRPASPSNPELAFAPWQDYCQRAPGRDPLARTFRKLLAWSSH